MSNQTKATMKEHKRDIARRDEIRLRNYFNADAFIAGFAMFYLKEPSLLAFDERRIKAPHNYSRPQK